MNNPTTISISIPHPVTDSHTKLIDAFTIVLADKEFMGEVKKVNKLLEALTIKNGVTKMLNQAYTYGEKDWALAFVNGKTTMEAKDKFIKEHILATDAYKRFMTVPTTGDAGEIQKAEKAKADAIAWIGEKFPENVATTEEE